MNGERMATVGLLLAATLGVVGCAPTTDAERDASPTPSPSASASATPDPDADPDAEIDAAIAEAEGMLPIPVEEIAEWSKTVVPGSDAEGHAGSLAGWLSDATSAHHTTRFQSLEPGAYQAQIACRGEGTISISGGDLDVGLSPEPTQCSNATIAFDVNTTATGLEVVLDLDGDPSVYAVSLRRVG
ncbi:hypothetical protein [Microbacterium sp. 1.5R]|uniref:hypothetical protein n=1 Tax=Microbacterium sp. 1.5R TaxID=1916917 RepID=UPI00119E1354|nr:hypothetical protein [Microbacterium sp. 1.5R]